MNIVLKYLVSAEEFEQNKKIYKDNTDKDILLTIVDGTDNKNYYVYSLIYEDYSLFLIKLEILNLSGDKIINELYFLMYDADFVRDFSDLMKELLKED